MEAADGTRYLGISAIFGVPFSGSGLAPGGTNGCDGWVPSRDNARALFFRRCSPISAHLVMLLTTTENFLLAHLVFFLFFSPQPGSSFLLVGSVNGGGFIWVQLS